MSPRDIQRVPDDSAPLSNARIAAVLAEIAELLDIKGASPFKVAAYRRAADSVARSGVEVAAAVRAGESPRLQGVGRAISERLTELAWSGRLRYHEALREEVPPTLLELLAIPGMGPRRVGEVWRSLGIATLDELGVAAREGRLQQLRGISGGTETRISQAIDELQRRPPRRRLMAEAHAQADHLLALVEALPGVSSAAIAGSVRRGCETVGDLDIVVETEQPARVLAALAASPAMAPSVPRTGDRHDRASVRLLDGPQVDVLTMPPGVAGSYLVHLTGAAAHNVALRHRARAMGWSLSEHGLTSLADPQANPLTFPTEADLYAFLGLSDIPPELREDHGEIEAAERGALPSLVRRADLRGDCHSHSDWSDGREPLELMAASARRAGLEYLVLTDHSQSLTIAHGLTPARVEAQRREIGQLNERFARDLASGDLPEGASPRGFQLLHGTELEITLDGRLDYDDELLARFDVVVASLHVGRRQPRAQLMARYELAMRSPHVDIISHPSGRKIGQRPELDLDWEAFYRLAAETGTLLEINGSPARLDLDEHHVRAAAEAGCRFTIDSDAHDRAEQQNLDWGCAIARRGWLGPDRVANSLPREAFLALLQEKPFRY